MADTQKWTVKNILKDWLRKHRFDGLFNDYIECACEIDDLMPCGENSEDCQAGHRLKCDCGGHDFHMGSRGKGKHGGHEAYEDYSMVDCAL